MCNILNRPIYINCLINLNAKRNMSTGSILRVIEFRTVIVAWHTFAEA